MGDNIVNSSVFGNDYKTIREHDIYNADCDIVVRMKNEGKYLDSFLDSLFTQKNVNYNLIVLDSGSTDDSVKIIHTRTNATTYLLPPEKFNFGESLDFLFSRCVSKIVFIFSAHIIFEDQDVIRNTIDYFNQNEKVMAGCFRQIPNNHSGCSILESSFLKRRFPSTKEPKKIPNQFNRIIFSNAGAIYRKAAWESLKFGSYNGSEDKIWAYQAGLLGYEIRYFGNRSILHSHQETSEQIYKRLKLNYDQQYQFSGICPNPYMNFIKYAAALLVDHGFKHIRTSIQIARMSYRAAYDTRRRGRSVKC